MTRQHRLLEVINFSNICLSEKNNLTVINAKTDVPYGSFSSANLILVQSFATFYDELDTFGYTVSVEMTQNTDEMRVVPSALEITSILYQCNAQRNPIFENA